FAASGIPEMKEFSRTLISWREEIINSFIVVKQRHTVDKDTGQVVLSDIKLNNGLTENRNSIIKTIKKAANGYTNWERFRSRCLYVLRKSSNPMLNPVIPPKKTRQ
ncbi:MAG: transposase, partial [Erysipelotrichaceae bacterium]|nr:transposase [Erysipelotrichaceae bacterium]